MAPILILAASLVAAFVLWYACSLVPGSIARGLARAAFIAVLCSPGLLVGHGIAVVPSLFALAVQPSIFTLGSMLLVWLIATGVILAVPGLRAHRSPWPPALEEVVLAAYPVKFAFFGLVAALLMLALLFADHHSTIWVLALQYGMLFTGAALNWMLCCVAVRRHRAAPVLTPLAFAAPALPAAAPIVFLVWYAGGLIGGRQEQIQRFAQPEADNIANVGSGRRRHTGVTRGRLEATHDLGGRIHERPVPVENDQIIASRGHVVVPIRSQAPAVTPPLPRF